MAKIVNIIHNRNRKTHFFSESGKTPPFDHLSKKNILAISNMNRK